ncbi:two-component system sensor histidine kinase DesK [Tamaricihabitans halophyticus]|uniref:Two-component system sensor histidine kinase DesK n=1 Tax=Tamaricihabitans halophyticus TaxID=1262583 RepID=A0A4R2R5T3_9PSEU|nr:sensor histidine kinase [Tamaricihabitans halophyticus]TCP54941.1 two-component system sensor histidine kinase DesK [Tamaricihabitans halophyticus]
MQWIHLIYLGMPVFQPAFDPAAGPWDWVLVAAIIVLYLPLYVIGWVRTDRARWWSTVPTVVLGVLTVPLNAGASVLFVYAAAVAGISERRRDALRWFVGLTVLVIGFASVSTIATPARLWAFVPPLLFIWIIGLTQIENAERARATVELRLRNARIEHLATVAERERIARELHDLLGHSLTAMIMHAQLVRQLVGKDPERARETAGRIEQTAREALGEVRATVTGWRQSSLDAEFDSARQTMDSAGVAFAVHQDSELRLVPSTEHELALAVRETVTNVVRHAGAAHCRVDLGARDGELVLSVADDGRGGQLREGNGLTGLRERITALGGLVHLSGASGTTVTIMVPLEVATG